jgi:hypothetical protein
MSLTTSNKRAVAIPSHDVEEEKEDAGENRGAQKKKT